MRDRVDLDEAADGKAPAAVTSMPVFDRRTVLGDAGRVSYLAATRQLVTVVTRAAGGAMRRRSRHPDRNSRIRSIRRETTFLAFHRDANAHS